MGEAPDAVLYGDPATDRHPMQNAIDGPLTGEQYIKRHLEYAGIDHEVFSDEASKGIYRYSSGSARLVNKVCTSTLIFGYQSGRRIIDDHMVKLVINGELS